VYAPPYIGKSRQQNLQRRSTMPDDRLNLVIDELKYLREQVDKVRTEDIPTVKTDVALLVEANKSASRWQTTVGSIMAVVMSVIIDRFHK
jgi:hypothetical protein